MTTIQFIEKPGFRERQLKRRFNNPLFMSSQNQVSQPLVDIARQQDKEEVVEFIEALQTLLTEVGTFSGREETDKIIETKERADRLYEQCVGLTGDHTRERDGLLKLNEAIMKAIWSAAGDDPLAIEELTKEQQAREIHLKLLDYALVVDMLRTDSAIAADELLPTILSENEESIHIALSLFDAEQRQVLVEEANRMKQSLQDQGQLSDDVHEKFTIMMSAPQ